MTSSEQHPGVTALEERLRLLKNRGDYWDKMADAASCDKREAELLEAVKEAQARFVHFREQRAAAATATEDHRKRVLALEATIEAARKDDLIAQALWLKLLTENHAKATKRR
jgi:hypothetical protein